MKKKLCKSDKSKIFLGVCGGFGQYFDVDPTIVRFVFAALCFLSGAGFFLYLIAAVILPPSEETDFFTTNKDSSEFKENENNKSPHTEDEFNSYFDDK